MSDMGTGATRKRRGRPLGGGGDGPRAKWWKRYYAKNKDRIAARQRVRRERDVEADRAAQRQRYLRKKRATVGPLPSSVWIPVAERLPEDDVNVLMVVEVEEGENVWIGWRDKDGWFTMDGTGVDVTHWMPLPESPSSDIYNEVKR
jgi:hypothetical protein